MSRSGTYHHGDLRAACIRAARELLEEDGSAGLSLRAVARRAGVSATAPYRHFADREALVSAVAAEGVQRAGRIPGAGPSRTLDTRCTRRGRRRLRTVHAGAPGPVPGDVRGALRPHQRGAGSRDRGHLEYVRAIVDATFPGVDADALSTTVWALVHGLAFLHLDGKLDSSTPEIVTAQVTSAVHALFNAAPAMSGRRRPAFRHGCR